MYNKVVYDKINFERKTSKILKLMSIIIPFIWIVSSTFILNVFTKERFEVILPVTFLIGTFILYFFGLFFNLLIGFYFLILLIILGFIVIVLKKMDLKSLIKNYISLGFIIFVILYIYISFYHRYTYFSFFDEFLHWGTMVKEQFRLEQFYSVTASNLNRHKDYPPLIQLFETLWCFMVGRYAETYLYRALAILSLSFLLPITSKLDIKIKKHWIYGLFMTLGIMLINSINFISPMNGIFVSIYIDFPMAIMAGYVIYLIIVYFNFNNRFNLFNIILTLSALLLTKQMAIAFYAMALFLFLGLGIIAKKQPLKQLLKNFVLIIIVPLTIFKSWSLYTSQFDLNPQFQISQFSISSFIDIAFRKIGDSWRIEVFDKFINSCFTVSLVNFIIPLSYFTLVIIVLGLLFIILKFSRSFKKYWIILLTYLIGACGYAFTMLLLYLFSFGEYESSYLASFNRYMETYILFGFILCFLFILYLVSNEIIEKYKTKVYIITLLIIMIFVNTNVSILQFKEYNNYQETSRVAYLENQINDLPDGTNILLVMQYYDDFLLIARYLYPQYNFNSVTLGSSKYSGDETVEYNEQDWHDLLLNYDYIYTYNTNYEFYQNYWKPIADFDFINYTLYKLENGKVVDN